MKQQLDNGVGKKSFRDYIIVIDKYLVPFFGDVFVTSIDYEMLQKFALWREEKMGRTPRKPHVKCRKNLFNLLPDFNSKSVVILFPRRPYSSSKPQIAA